VIFVSGRSISLNYRFVWQVAWDGVFWEGLKKITQRDYKKKWMIKIWIISKACSTKQRPAKIGVPPNRGVSKNRGTPKSSILIGFSIINHPFWGNPIFGNTHLYIHIHKGHKAES